MAGPLLPLLGVVAEFIMANGARAAAMRYGPKAVEQGLNQIKKRQSAINRRVGKMKEKGEIPLREKTPLQQQKSLETRLANERAKRMRGEAPRSRFDEEGFPLDEVPLQFAEGDVVASGRRPGTTGPNVQRNIPGRTTGVADKVLTGSGRPPVGTMATPKTGLLPTQTLSRMGTLSRGGIAGLLAAGGLGLFEIGRQTGFEPEKLGQAAAQVQKSIEEVASEAVEVARELGQPIQDFVNRVVMGYQSEMGESDRLERMMMGGQGRAISNMDRDRVSIDIPRSLDEMRDEDIQIRNMMQQEQLGFAAGDEVDVDALPKGLKAMYDSGPKGREGVENIAAKTDKFAEGGAVESEIDAALSDIQSVAPEAQAIGQIMTMVMEMIQAGASEEQVIQALMQMGLDEEDIQQVMMMIAEQMQGQDPIQSQLSQMM